MSVLGALYEHQLRLPQQGAAEQWEQYRVELRGALALVTNGVGLQFQPVGLHVYHLGPKVVSNNEQVAFGAPGYLLVHGGIEVFGKEVSAGRNGLYMSEPKHDSNHIYWETITLGLTACGPNDVSSFLRQFVASGNVYAETTNNCLDFRAYLSTALGAGPIPSKFNAAAMAARQYAPWLTQTLLSTFQDGFSGSGPANAADSSSEEETENEAEQLIKTYSLMCMPHPFNKPSFQDKISKLVGGARGATREYLNPNQERVTGEVHTVKTRWEGDRKTWTVTKQSIEGQSIWFPVTCIVHFNNRSRTGTGNRYRTSSQVAYPAFTESAPKRRCL
mmetsp:Transcript_130228/g.236673  ORF Transcript_130228/g.236673 Transcript_130228/m.236673 type:complete len:332 (+) Transcript_130228:54-1049(+)